MVSYYHQPSRSLSILNDTNHSPEPLSAGDMNAFNNWQQGERPQVAAVDNFGPMAEHFGFKMFAYCKEMGVTRRHAQWGQW